jgi:hypothetical protein
VTVAIGAAAAATAGVAAAVSAAGALDVTGGANAADDVPVRRFALLLSRDLASNASSAIGSKIDGGAIGESGLASE